jgi:hypothetical protein
MGEWICVSGEGAGMSDAGSYLLCASPPRWASPSSRGNQVAVFLRLGWSLCG